MPVLSDIVQRDVRFAPPPQNEQTRFHPRSPYACAKLFAHSVTTNYRESYGLFACSGILFNHESPRRRRDFRPTRKDCASHRPDARRDCGDKLYIGNMEARRDWGYAPEYVEAMWMMLQQKSPDDYVIGTGECHSVKEFLELAFGHVNLDWQKYVEVDPRYFRPAEVDNLLADPTKAARELRWRHRTDFRELVRIMVHAETIALTENNATPTAIMSTSEG